MISRFAIKKFLSRELESFDWIKSLGRKELLAAVDELEPKPQFVGPYKPYQHQLVAFLIGTFMPGFLYLLDLGVGKTRIALDLIAYRKLKGDQPKFLVLVPNVANIEDWIIDAKAYAPSLVCVPLDGPSTDRRQLLKRTADLFILNYAGLVALCTTLQPKSEDKRKRVIDREKMDWIIGLFNGIVLDESTSIIHRSSLTYKICNQFARHIDLRYALTGTPFGRDPQALWTQFYFIDRGNTLGQTLGIFRAAFFTQKKQFWGGYEFTFKKELTEKLHRVLRNRSIFYPAEECIDLPEAVSVTKHVMLTSEMKVYYGKLAEQLRLAKGNFRIVQNSFLNMRQICSGFIGLIDDESGDRAQIEFSENPKLDVLLSLINELPIGAKMVIFYEYIWSGNQISTALMAKGIKHERLWGGQKDPKGALRRFREYPEYRILLVNSKSGAFGLNLQIANYMAIYESPTSPIIRKQIERRIRRSGQKAKRCFYYDIVMKDTVDERILTYLAEGRDLFSAIVKGEAQV